MNSNEPFPIGTKIGFKDINGNELSVGDEVKCTRTLTHPNWDGWGRDIPAHKEKSTQTDSSIGKVIYLPHRGEFVVHIPKWANFSLYEFDRIELVQ